MPAAPYGQGQDPVDPDPYADPGATSWLEAGPAPATDPYAPRTSPPATTPPPSTMPPRRAPAYRAAREPRPLRRAEAPEGLEWLYAPTVSRYLVNGVVASVVGTIVLGIVMQAMGLLDAIAIRADVTVASVWFVLFVVHILLGFVLGFVLATMPRSRPLTGVLFGLTVWLVWGMIALPVWLGASGTVLDFSENWAWALAIAYLAYGFTAGLVAWWMEPREELREVRGFRPTPTRY